jgi:hypothetical protein
MPTAISANVLDQTITNQNMAGNAFKSYDTGHSDKSRQSGIESRQSDVCRRVMEDLAIKYSKIDRRSGSINPRRQNPIVKQ